MKQKYKKLIVQIENKFYYYVCNVAEWNYWLNRYYPKTALILIVEKHITFDLIGSFNLISITK